MFMNMKIGYRTVMLVVVAIVAVIFFFKGKIFDTLTSLELTGGRAATENYQPTIPTVTFSSETKSTLNEIGKLNNEVLTLSEKSKTAPQVQKSQNVAELKTDLKARAAKIQLLVAENPDAALVIMLPPKAIADITQQAPIEAGRFLEKSITLSNAVLRVIHIDNFDPSDPKKSTGEIQYYITKNTSEQRLYLAGGELELTSGTVANINGYQLSSGDVLAASGATSLQIISVPTPESVGEQKTLTILVNFTDSWPIPFTEEQAKELVFNGPMQKYYRENSYSKTWFTGDVVGWYTLPRKGFADGYCQWPQLNYLDDFDSLFKRDNINLANYGRILFLASHPCMYGGFSSVGKYDHYIGGQIYKLSESWVGSLDYYNPDPTAPPLPASGLPSEWRVLDYVLAHELGHALGVVHANGWSCSNAILYGDDCRHQEYGNWFDVMGAGAFSLHFNAYFKNALGWLKNDILNVGNTFGKYVSYQLFPLESNTLPLGARTYRAISITPPGFNRPVYFLENRKAIGYDSNLNDPDLKSNTKGVFVNWIPERGQWAPMSRLLDMTPSGNYNWNAVTLAPNTEYTDLGRGVTIKVGDPKMSVTGADANVKVKTFPPVCQKLAPVLGDFYLFNSIYPGDSIFTSSFILNADSPSCSSSLYKLAIILPSGWQSTYIYPDEEFRLESGELLYDAIAFSVPSDAFGGSYPITFKVVKYKADGVTVDKITERTFYIYVNSLAPSPSPFPKPTPGPSTTPTNSPPPPPN